jgi:MoxR-like ATPase
LQANLKGRDFFRPGPLMRALECEKPCVLLIDELDKVDEGFEALLLEILSAWQLSIPEFGTVEAKSIPFVVLTSNEERRLGDPIRRRSLYVRVEHPTPEREAEIIASRTPGAGVEFHREIAGIARSFRNYSLEKPPSVSEMIDFANALRLMGSDHVTEEQRDVLLPFLAKTEKDRRHLLLREGFQSLLVDGARNRVWRFRPVPPAKPANAGFHPKSGTYARTHTQDVILVRTRVKWRLTSIGGTFDERREYQEGNRLGFCGIYSVSMQDRLSVTFR